MFAHYHKNFLIFKQAFKHNKRMDLSCKMNPVILGSISGAGLLLGTYAETKNYNPKIELCRFAYTTYAKILTHLRSYLRGIPFEEKKLLNEINLIDGIIIHLVPTANEKLKSNMIKKFKVQSTNKVDPNIYYNYARSFWIYLTCYQ